MIYFCIPSYNEEHTVGVVLWKIRQVMAEFGRDYQILLVDDASTDATTEVLEPYQRVLPLHVFRNERRQGYGSALQKLLEEAVRRSDYPKRDVAVVIQADFTEEPADVPNLIKRLEGGADVATGVARVERPYARRSHRLVQGLSEYLVDRLDMPENGGDPLVGLRAYRLICVKKALDAYPDGLVAGASAPVASARLLQRIAPHARRLEEVDVTYRYDRRLRDTRLQPVSRLAELLRYVLRRERIAAAQGGDDDGSANGNGAGGGGRRGRGRRGRSRTAAQGNEPRTQGAQI